jgi:hypothetical protein
VAHQSTCWTGSRCNWLARSAGQRTQYSVLSWTQRERRWGRDGGRRERERDLEREERWRDLGGSVCLPAVSLLLLLLYLCHNFSETHLVSFGGVLLFLGWVFFFMFRFGICLLSQEVICLSPFRRVPNWVAAPIARCSGQIGV